jgi:hypothetical protein
MKMLLGMGIEEGTAAAIGQIEALLPAGIVAA